jgi:hypothetical protein
MGPRRDGGTHLACPPRVVDNLVAGHNRYGAIAPTLKTTPESFMPPKAVVP